MYCMQRDCKTCERQRECDKEENKNKKKVSKCLWKNGKTLKGMKRNT